ncbi:MAG: MFS transporter [Alphaproteobacteria bacterium]|nr:MFS transporter [Alphaproteobacteria bacterium]
MRRLFRPTGAVLALLCLMYFINYLDRVNVSTAAAGFSTEFKLNRTQIGLVFSAFAYPYLVFQIIGGWVSDRFGTRRTLIVCGMVWMAADISMGLSTGLVSLLAARVLLGLGEGATFPAATAAMSRWVAKANRGFAQGITHAFARIGNALAPGVIVVIMTTYGWRASFYVCACFALAWVAAWAFTFTEEPRNHPGITPEEVAVLPVVQSKAKAVPWGRLARRMAPVTLVYFCYGWNLWLFLSWIPQYFLHSYDMQITKSAIFASGVFFAGVVGDTLGGIVTDRLLHQTGNLKLARSAMVALCMILTALSLLPLLFVHDLYVSLACLAAGFFFAEMTIGPMWAVPMDIASDLSGTASGMMNCGSALAAIISPVAGGYIIDSTRNWELPFAGTIILMVIGAAMTFAMKPQQKLEINA